MVPVRSFERVQQVNKIATGFLDAWTKFCLCRLSFLRFKPSSFCGGLACARAGPTRGQQALLQNYRFYE